MISSISSSAPAQWSVSSAYPAGPTVVYLGGEVDADAAPALQTCLIGGIERGADLVVDLTGVLMIDCSCLGVLVRARCRARALGLVVAVAAPPPPVLRILTVTGVDQALPVFTELAQARLALRQHALEHVWPERLRRAHGHGRPVSRWRRLLTTAVK